jgi:hypothetical protein
MHRSHTFAGLLLASTLAGCGSDTTGPGGGAQVTLNLASRAASGANASAAALAVSSPVAGTFADGINTLVLQRVQLVVREIELKRADRDVVCTDEQANEDDCEELELGPTLFDVPLSAGARQAIVATVEPGTYDAIEFEIHKPEDDDAGDAAFIAANPGFANVSVRVEGTYNGTPFVFTSDLGEDQEFELSPPLVVAGSAETELTLFIDLAAWFQTPDGGLLDPATANDGGANRNVVRDNIRNSIEAFGDDDGNGRDD